ncbi:branched-chain alpha-keto acid dehydrogenase subunit E2 [Parenemella sanctibonifatiensis]|uniref:Dihydrolipoamide acetyltransferase component of pyruvate dehydrogenase complex n=1 Tax=Parenemella sanctibonifatiensis TaxID=2016505 RepID=A0A255EFW8_9ACTN|nr:branched-chain alpha-keto acid dehydrogenase subunit E2 [Parenemella sanctibonifatiensis]
MKDFRLPDPGEGLVEADIVSWRVAVGDEVKVNDVLLEIETSKSLVELPSPYAGTVVKFLVEEGQTVEVGTPIITIDDGEDEAPEGSGPNLVGYGSTGRGPKRRPRREKDPSPEHELIQQSLDYTGPVGRRSDDVTPFEPEANRWQAGEPLPSPGVPERVDSGADRPKAKPPVRKYARERGVDLAEVSPTGPDGTITREDIDRALANPGTGKETRIPVKGVRKATADAMVKSFYSAPHASEWITFDVSNTMELVEQLKARREFRDVRVTPLLVYIRAICLTLKKHPELNATWDEKNREIVQHGQVNMGIAAATPRGLMVPNIKGAEQLTLLELAQQVTDLVATARAGKLQPRDYAHGTITLTNVGVFGVDSGTAILNPDETVIVAMGSIERRPWVLGTGADERIEPRWVTTVSMTFDHRVIDGEQASLFLKDLAGLLRDPALAMIY